MQHPQDFLPHPPVVVLPNFASMIATELEPPRRVRHKKSKFTAPAGVERPHHELGAVSGHNAITTAAHNMVWPRFLEYIPQQYSGFRPSGTDLDALYFSSVPRFDPSMFQRYYFSNKIECIFGNCPPLPSRMNVAYWTCIMSRMVHEFWEEVIVEPNLLSTAAALSNCNVQLSKAHFIQWLFQCLFQAAGDPNQPAGSSPLANKPIDTVAAGSPITHLLTQPFSVTTPADDEHQPLLVMSGFAQDSTSKMRICNAAFYMWVWKLWYYTHDRTVSFRWAQDHKTYSTKYVKNSEFDSRCFEGTIPEILAIESIKEFVKSGYATFLRVAMIAYDQTQSLYIVNRSPSDFFRELPLCSRVSDTPLYGLLAGFMCFEHVYGFNLTTRSSVWNSADDISLSFDPILLETSYSACRERTTLREKFFATTGLDVYYMLAPGLVDTLFARFPGCHSLVTTCSETMPRAPAVSPQTEATANEPIRHRKRPILRMTHFNNVRNLGVLSVAYAVISEICRRVGGSVPLTPTKQSSPSISDCSSLTPFDRWVKSVRGETLTVGESKLSSESIAKAFTGWLPDSTIQILYNHFPFFARDPECLSALNTAESFTIKKVSYLRSHQIRILQERDSMSQWMKDRAKLFETWDVIVGISVKKQASDKEDKGLPTTRFEITKGITDTSASPNTPASATDYFSYTNRFEIILDYFPSYQIRSYFGRLRYEAVPLLQLTLEEQPELISQIWNQLVYYYTQLPPNADS